MQIIVVGDTHGHLEDINRELKRHQADCLLFTGDFLADGMDLAANLAIPFYGVSGNCDRSHRDIQEQLLKIDDIRIYIIHGHQYGVKTSLMKLYYRALEVGANVVLYGHTHIPKAEEIDGIWFVNPGSPVFPRSGHPGTYALVSIEEGIVAVDIMDLEK